MRRIARPGGTAGTCQLNLACGLAKRISCNLRVVACTGTPDGHGCLCRRPRAACRFATRTLRHALRYPVDQEAARRRHRFWHVRRRGGVRRRAGRTRAGRPGCHGPARQAGRGRGPLERRAGRARVHRRGVSQPPAWALRLAARTAPPSRLFRPLPAGLPGASGRRSSPACAAFRGMTSARSRRDAPRRADAAGPPHALATFTRSAIRTRMPNLSSLRFMYLNIETKSASARAPGRSPRIFDLTNRNTFAYAA